MINKTDLQKLLEDKYPSGLVLGDIAFKLSISHEFYFDKMESGKPFTESASFKPGIKYTIKKWNKNGIVPSQKLLINAEAGDDHLTIPFWKITSYTA